jgi:hypothetical protein
MSATHNEAPVISSETAANQAALTAQMMDAWRYGWTG